MEIRNRTVVLTGATGGIGRAVAKLLDAAGARLVLVARDAGKLEALVREVGESRHIVLSADLAFGAGRTKLREICGGIACDVTALINCLGINELRLFADQSEDCVERQIRTNLLCPMLVCHDLLPVLQRQTEALIVNVGSTFGSIGYPGFSSYCASKFGLRGFTEALRRELTDTTVRVSYVAPRATRTALNSPSVNAMNEALGASTDEPAAVARQIVRMISGVHRADHFIGWPEKLFVRINAVLPRIVDKSMRKRLPLIRRFAQDIVK